ncbi:hypothetical protein GE09DRAFT_1228147 [Coniochaeta sp. 2T2.1]|nr:hypothetical protein GE09DRAFT_1228147 [Coniochaeta sp. 2T2.1]
MSDQVPSGGMASDETASHETMPSIVALPVEIANHIASHLSTPDISALRLTCKAMGHLLRESFFRNSFREKQFDMHDASLQALVDMSGNPMVSQSLEHLALGLEHSRLAFMEFPHHALPKRRNPEELQQMQLFLARQQHFQRTGAGIALLMEAFANLPKIKTVSIRDFSTARDSRHLEWGSCPDWSDWSAVDRWDDVEFLHSYGTDASLHAVGRLITELDNEDDNIERHPRRVYDHVVGDAFNNVLVSLAKADARPDAIEVIIRHWCWALSDLAFYLPPSLRINLGPVLHNLKKLHLDLRLSDEVPHEYHRSSDLRRGAQSLNLSPFLVEFLSLTPKLQWLKLGLTRSLPPHKEQLLRWLAADQNPAYGFYSGKFAQPIEFVHLGHLQISGARLPYYALVGLIRRLAGTLTNLDLKRFKIFVKERPVDGDEHVWSRFLRFLATQADLKSFSLENAGIAVQHGFYFYIRGGDDCRTRAWNFHTPSDMKQSLEGLAKDIGPLQMWESEDSEQDYASDDSEDDDTDDG